MNNEDSNKRSGGTGIRLQSSQPLYNPKKQEPTKSTHNFSQKTGEKALINFVQDDIKFCESYQSESTNRSGNHSHHSNHGNDHIYKEHNSHQHIERDCSHDDGAHGHKSHSKHPHQHLEHNHEHFEHNHQHHEHNGHNHQHPEHDHIHDAHEHSHYDHSHQHVFPSVYIPPLPSWMKTLSHLAPVQKTIFSWFVLHSVIGVWLYCMGTSRESLSLVGFSYLMIFDALGVLNAFVSSVLRSNQEFAIKNSKRPFGAHRYEVVFGLGTTIYLMFATMHNTKESLHHFLLEEHHNNEANDKEDHHLKLSLGMFFLIGFAITATCISSIALRNHDNFVRYLRRRPTTVHGFSYNVINRARGNPIHALLSNVYSLAIALCGSVILVSYMFGIATPFVDKFLALLESVVMFYLGFPTAKALAKVLLQTTPNSLQNGVENRLREIQQDPNIIKVERVHFWQTTYGKCVGTIEIQVAAQADEQAMLQFVYQKLQGLTSNDEELTVSIIKS